MRSSARIANSMRRDEPSRAAVVQEPRAAKPDSLTAQRPTVSNLLLWTAGCCVYFAIFRSLIGEEASLRGVILLVGQSVATGAAIGAVLLYGGRWIGRRTMPLEPGEWLLFAQGINFFTGVALLLVAAQLPRGHAHAVAVLLSWIFLLPTFDRRIDRVWRCAFGGLVLLFTLPLVATALGGWRPEFLEYVPSVSKWSRLPGIGAASIVAVALAIDFRRGNDRHWLHWVGVAVLFYDVILNWIFTYVL